MVWGLWLATKGINKHAIWKAGKAIAILLRRSVKGTRRCCRLIPLWLICWLSDLAGSSSWVYGNSNSHLISFFCFCKFWTRWMCSSMVQVSSFIYRSATSLQLETMGNRHGFYFVLIGSSLPMWIPVCSCSLPCYIYFFFPTAILLIFGNFSFLSDAGATVFHRLFYPHS